MLAASPLRGLLTGLSVAAALSVTFCAHAEAGTAPDAVDDLRVVAMHIRTGYLMCTAPSDPDADLAGYDVRYSTAPINEANWDAASQAAGEPAPVAPGEQVQFVVEGLDPDTTYYFAMKSYDADTPVNTSGLSNVVSGKTMPPPRPVVIRNPWVANDRVANTRNIGTMGATYVNAYTPDGVVPPAGNEDKAINIYNNQKRRLYHWTNEPPGDISNPVYNQNVFGWSLCGRHAAQACTIVDAAGLTPRRIGLPGHWVYEVFYDGKYHFFDTMTTCYVYTRDNPPYVAGCQQIKQDNTLLTSAVVENRACPGFLLCGDTASGMASMINSYSTYGTGVVDTTGYSTDMDLRIGETFTRTWEAWANQHPTPSAGQPDPPFHHEADRDWKDYANFPYWEPYRVDLPYYGGSARATYRRWSNGTHTLAPDFRSPAYQAVLHSSTNIATFSDDGLEPDLHAATAGTVAEAVFKIDVPFYLTDASLSGEFFRADSGDSVKVYASNNGTSWTQVWASSADGWTQVDNLSLRDRVFGKWELYIKVQITANGSKADAGVSNLVVTATFEHNKGAMAYLDKGANNITVTFDNPQDLAAGGAVFKITYNWKEYDGADWTIARSYEQYITGSPTTFTITTGGTKVPRTESIILAVAEPPVPDGIPPAAITDLVADEPDSTHIDLVWTATGDDGFEGRAAGYDIRYSTAPITEANFDSATPVAQGPSPLEPGLTQRFTVTGLVPSTTYWFAIKVRDEGNNLSEISNVVSETTLPPDVTPPAAITDLAAEPGVQSGSVLLTWTAPGDDGHVKTATSYDIRYAAMPIDASTWDAATQVDDEPAPQAPGSAEQMIISGLPWNTRYYFAIKTADEVPNVSGLSNIAPGTSSGIGEKTFQYGADGYFGVQDNYIGGERTNNYGTYERMVVTGYLDYGVGALQRGLVQFDLSSIPTGTRITRATLHLYSYYPEQTKGSAGQYGAYPLTRNWTANSSSWYLADTSVNWSTPGGDFVATPDATTQKKSAAQVPAWYEWDVTDRVQQWIDGTSDNFGWLIRCTNEMLHNQDYFYQSDTANAELRPRLVVTDLVDDEVAPDPVVDLAASNPDSNTIDLMWTASGDDGMLGTADAYDIRYSTAPITEANFDAATPAANPPDPQPAGSAETFTVTGLESSTTYWFALKVLDRRPNYSAMSNVVTATTLPPDVTPPSAIDDLVASTGEITRVTLDWTAPGDDGDVGQAVSYDVRYSTSPITEANFASATRVAGVAPPKAAGLFERLVVTNLTGDTLYSFAIKTTDNAGNVSPLSNVAAARTAMPPRIGEVVLQNGLNGYAGTQDTYIASGSPDANYGDVVRSMVVSGSFDPAGTQRILVQFDTSSIPPGTKVTRATLRMYADLASTTSGDSGAYGLYRLLQPWTETGATWNSSGAGVWATPGGDAAATPDAVLPKRSPAETPCWYEWDVTAAAQELINDPQANHGWLVRCTDEGLPNRDNFVPREGRFSSQRPQLIVTDAPAHVPGDINQDGEVNALDLLMLAHSWNKALGDDGYDARCDLNGDNAVNAIDLLMLAHAWPTN